MLLFDQFDPTVLRSALLAVVGRDRRELATPVGSQARPGSAAAAGEGLENRLAAILSEFDVPFYRALIVGMTYHEDLEHVVALGRLRDLAGVRATPLGP